MAAEQKNSTGVVVAALVAGYLMLRNTAKPGGGKPPATSVTKKANGGGGGANAAYGLGAGAGAGLAAAAGLGGAVASLAALEVGAGAYVGYKAAGPAGAILGGLNPAGAGAVLAGRLAHDAAKDVGLNDAGADAAGVSGGALFAVATIGEIAAAAALLPTVGIVIGLAELIGLLFGSSNQDPTPQDQVDALYAVAANEDWVTHILNPSSEQRVQAAAQLVALANGPDKVTIVGVPAPNNFKPAARQRASQLGLDSLLN